MLMMIVEISSSACFVMKWLNTDGRENCFTVFFLSLSLATKAVKCGAKTIVVFFFRSRARSSRIFLISAPFMCGAWSCSKLASLREMRYFFFFSRNRWISEIERRLREAEVEKGRARRTDANVSISTCLHYSSWSNILVSPQSGCSPGKRKLSAKMRCCGDKVEDESLACKGIAE